MSADDLVARLEAAAAFNSNNIGRTASGSWVVRVENGSALALEAAARITELETATPYAADSMKAAGWNSARLTPPFGLSGAMYHADADDDTAIEVWWAT